MKQKPPEGRSLRRLVLRVVCAVFGHKYTRVEYIGILSVETSVTDAEGKPVCLRCHPIPPTLMPEMGDTRPFHVAETVDFDASENKE